MTSDFRIPVLCYHSLNARDALYTGNDHAALEEDLKSIDRNGFTILPLPVLVDWFTRGEHSKLAAEKYICITFDDGPNVDYVDYSGEFYVKSMHRILMEYSESGGRAYPGPLGVSFVIASSEAREQLDRTCIAGRGDWQDSWWRECSERGIIEIGNHSWDHLHPTLDRVVQREQRKGSFHAIDNEEDAYIQICRAQNFIEQRLGREGCRLFAYPWGHVSRYLCDDFFPNRLAEHKHVAAFATGGEPVTPTANRWALPRFVFGEHWRTPEEFQGILDAVQNGMRQVDASSYSAPVLHAAEEKQSDIAVVPQDVLREMEIRLRSAVDSALTEKNEPQFLDPSLKLDDLLCVVEVDDGADFLVGDLFRRRFGAPAAPDYPRHFVAFYKREPFTLEPIGYVHQTPWEQCYLTGGLVVDNQLIRRMPEEHRAVIWGQGGGVAEQLLRQSFKRVTPSSKAIWGYVGDPRAEKVDLRVGFVHTGHPFLMVIWNESIVSPLEKEQLVEKAAALGPF
jgi:peptidoglycan/xylan/chitin deacetylase (PgdA/CDA1 family)